MVCLYKLAVLAIFSGLTIYLAVIIYRFFSRRDFALQCEYYFGPTPPGRNQGQGVLNHHTCYAGYPHRKRVKSVVTHASRQTQEKSTPVPPKKPQKSAGDKGMQGRPELQITVPADRPQGQLSPIQLTLNQTVTTAPTQPSTLQPKCAVQGTVAWSPLPGPVTTTSATWRQPASQ